MVFALTGIGCPNEAVCQPEAVSLLNVTLPSRVPVEVHRLPVCVPTLVVAL